MAARQTEIGMKLPARFVQYVKDLERDGLEVVIRPPEGGQQEKLA